MPARREQSTRARADGRRPKASEKRTRGTAASSWPSMGNWSRRGVGAIAIPGASLVRERLSAAPASCRAKREDDDEMPCRNDRVTRWLQHRRELASLEILLRAQHWEIDLRELDPHYRMPRSRSAVCVGIGKAMAEMLPARIGTTLDDGHAPRYLAADAPTENLACRRPIRA